MIKEALKFVAQNIVGSVLANAGTQIGEAIGKRIGTRIYIEPKEPEKKKPRRRR